MSRPLYLWRQLTPEQQARVLAWRKENKRPWHGPPHRPNYLHTHFHITAACYEHRPHIGLSPDRMDAFVIRRAFCCRTSHRLKPGLQTREVFPSALGWEGSPPAEAGTPNLQRAESYARRYGWFLKMDVRKYFVGYRVFPHELRLTRPPSCPRKAVFRSKPRWNKARCE